MIQPITFFTNRVFDRPVKEADVKPLYTRYKYVDNQFNSFK